MLSNWSNLMIDQFPKEKPSKKSSVTEYEMVTRLNLEPANSASHITHTFNFNQMLQATASVVNGCLEYILHLQKRTF